jgi:hypothetical protein
VSGVGGVGAAAIPDATPVDATDGRSQLAARVGDRLHLLVLAIALLPVVTAIARRSGDRWIPIGDNALIELRARDVFSLDHFPLLGTWSSASLSAGKDLNHPGPLLFDLLAVPVKLFGGSTGVVLGVGLVNAAAIIGTVLVARRAGGRTAALAAAAVAALLAFTLGSAMLTDPWNPHVLVLPALFALVCTWAVASGDLAVLPWLFVATSLCLQTHLGYAYLVPALVITALAGATAVYRRRWRLDAAARSADVPRLRRTGVISLLVLLVLWAQPLLEQLFGEGQGNLARIATSTGGDEPTIGATNAVRIAGGVLAVPPWWSRGSFVDAVPYTPYSADGVTLDPAGLRSTGVAVLGLVVLAGLLGLAGWWSVRRRDRAATIAAVVAAIVIVLAIGSLTIMPIGPLGLTPHQMRWLWSIGAFCVLALSVAGVRALGRPDTLRVGGVFAAIAVVVSLANVPVHVQPAGPDTFPEAIPVAQAISDQVRQFHTDESVVLDSSNLRYLEPYSAVVMSAMQQADVDLRVTEAGLVRQLGNARRAAGDEPLTVYLLEGRAALDVPAGSQRIAFTSPLDQASLDGLLEGERAMIDEIAAFGIVLTPEGEQLAADGAFGLTAQEIVDASFDPATFVTTGLAAELVAAGALQLDPSVAELFASTSALRRQVGTTTVAVLIRPS